MPYLQIVNGTQAGQRHDLKAAAVLGRHPECDVVLDVGAVSRQHAKIEKAGESFFLEDLKSRNGTVLNDVVLEKDERKPLADGDRLQICDVLMVFHDDRPKPAKPPVKAAPAKGPQNLLASQGGDSSFGALLVDDEEEEGGTTIMSTIEVGTIGGGLQISASAEAKLAALLEINRCLGRQLALDEVLPQVLESLFRIFVQADRGFIVLEDERGNLIPRWTKLRNENSTDQLRISRTIVKQVMEGKEAVLSEDAASDKRFVMSQSIADFRIRSMMCAPLVDSNGKAFGVLQIDTLDRRKRFQKDDLDVLASVATQAGIAIDNARLHEQALRQRELSRDLDLARTVQRSLVPRKPPELGGYRFFHFYESANQVGGDYFDYVPLAGGRVAVVVADVVGHGVAAALLMARLSSQVRFCLAGGAEPSEALAQVNGAFSEIGIDSRFVTFWLGVLDPKTHALTIANAGHMPTMIRRASGQVEEIGHDQTGVPLGVVDDMQYEQFTVTLEPGEMVMMYTDGVNESMDPAGEQYTIERIKTRFSQPIKSIEQFGESLIADVRRHMATAPQGDDMCLVCFART